MRRFCVLLVALCVALCLVFVSTAAFASDGVIEINQARALAGGVTPTDSAGFPVTISQSGSYRLTSNLTSATGTIDVIDINVSDVTIDLNGFSILGPNACSGTPTSCTLTGTSGVGINSSANRITVRNGSVKGMVYDGVELVGAYERVENVRASQNGSGGLYLGNSSVIVGCTSDANGDGGITAGDYALIQNCTAVNNAFVGFSVNSGIISGCISKGSGTEGINVSNQALVTGCAAIGNTGLGLSVGAGSAYSNCLFSGNNSTGLQVSGGIQIGTNICNGAACP